MSDDTSGDGVTGGPRGGGATAGGPATHVRHRSSGADGQKRDLTYPAPPQPLVVPVYDNHTHLEIADGVGDDGDGPLDYREHLDRASAVGVRGVVQVGTEIGRAHV